MNEYNDKHKLNIDPQADTTDEMPDPRDVEREALRAAGLLPQEQEAVSQSGVHAASAVQEPRVEQTMQDADIYADAEDFSDLDDERERELDRRERELARREQELRRRERMAQDDAPQHYRRERHGRRTSSEREERYDERPEPDRRRGSARGNASVANGGERQNRRRKRHHPVRNFFLVLLLFIVLFIGWFLFKVNSMIEGGLSLSDIESYISDEVKNSQASGAMAGYTNIALFGLDSTEGDLESGNNRSDIMIIASINNSTGEIKLVSLYRDTYLDIGDGNYQKANAAYAYGGPEQAVAMLNKNLDLNISDYVVTGFEGIASVIDAVGGIEIDVAEDEISHLNNYQTTMSQETGLAYKEVTQAGPQTLTGLQATAYCRIRYTDGGDFKRTERQKEVLTKTFEKLKSSGPLTMISVANTVMDKVRTSLSMTEIAALAVKATTYSIGETNGLPIESLRTVGYIGDQSCVIPIHLSDNVVWLHQYLFNDTNYAVSSTVQEISNTISVKSGF